MTRSMFDNVMVEYKHVIQQLSVVMQFKSDPKVNEYTKELLGKKRCLEALWKQITNIKTYGIRTYNGLDN